MAAFVLGTDAHRWAWLVTGAIVVGWGLAVAFDYRGLARAMPTESGFGPFRQTTSTPMIRLIFGGFAVWGAVIFGLGAVAAYHALT